MTINKEQTQANIAQAKADLIKAHKEIFAQARRLEELANVLSVISPEKESDVAWLEKRALEIGLENLISRD